MDENRVRKQDRVLQPGQEVVFMIPTDHVREMEFPVTVCLSFDDVNGIPTVQRYQGQTEVSQH